MRNQPGPAPVLAGMTEQTPDPAAAERARKYGTLPPRIAPEDQVVEIPSDPPHPPQVPAQSDEELVIRYAGG